MISSSPPLRIILNYPTGYPLRYAFEEVFNCLRDRRQIFANFFLLLTSIQRQEHKMLERGRSSRLTDDRIKLLNKVDFVWEAQRGGPRRKRKAAVSVPPEPKPANKTKRRQLRAGQYAMGGGLFQGHSNTMASIAAGMNTMPMQMQPFWGDGGALSLAVASRDNSLAQMPGRPWLPMMNGAFQQVPSMGRSNSQSYLPLAPPGYHFGLVPNLSFPQSLNANAAQRGGKIQAQLHVNDDTEISRKQKEDNDANKISKPATLSEERSDRSDQQPSVEDGPEGNPDLKNMRTLT